MGSLQKKEMEVSFKMKEDMQTLQRQIYRGFKLPEGGNLYSARNGSNGSTLSFSQDQCNRSNGTLAHTTSKGGNLKLSKAFITGQLTKLSSSDANIDQNGSFDVCEDSFHSFGAPVTASTVKSSIEFSDARCEVAEPAHHRFVRTSVSKRKTSNPSRDAFQSGNGDVAYNNNKGICLLESVREQELGLSNLSLNGPISLADISRSNNLLNLINYFPQKAPHFCSKKKLLILDINGILADIVYPPPKGYKADTKIAGRAVFTRPFCSDFLSFCLERFNVAIWSSRSRKIIDRLVKYLMGDMKHKLIFCWDLSHCTESNFRTLENKHKALVFKELSKVWEAHGPDYPWEKGFFNESNTLLLDDTPYKALLNPPHTAIFPYSYDFKDRADIALGPRGNIRAYLEELAMADNVQKYIEQHPFGQSAITERSLSWHFYNKVIKGHNTVPVRG